MERKLERRHYQRVKAIKTSKIIYQKNSDDAPVILWKIRAYNNKKLVFTFNHINDLAFQKIMKQFFNNNIETREK